MVTRFFKLSPDQGRDHLAYLVPQDDVLPLDTFKNVKEVYRDDEKIIVYIAFSNRDIADIANFCNAEDPLSLEALLELGIAHLFCGNDYTDTPGTGLFWFFPELKGTIDQEFDGEQVKIPIVKRVHFLGDKGA